MTAFELAASVWSVIGEWIEVRRQRIAAERGRLRQRAQDNVNKLEQLQGQPSERTKETP